MIRSHRYRRRCHSLAERLKQHRTKLRYDLEQVEPGRESDFEDRLDAFVALAVGGTGVDPLPLGQYGRTLDTVNLRPRHGSGLVVGDEKIEHQIGRVRDGVDDFIGRVQRAGRLHASSHLLRDMRQPCAIRTSRKFRKVVLRPAEGDGDEYPHHLISGPQLRRSIQLKSLR